MTIGELLLKLDAALPFETAEEWDNCGLIIGDTNERIEKIALSLDATSEVLDVAISEGFRALITHHPIIFQPIKKIDFSDFSGSIIRRAIKSDVSIIALHTNWDKKGLNETLAKMLELQNIEPLQNGGFGMVGDLKKSVGLEKFADYVKKNLGLSHVVCHSPLKKISRVALCGGAGGDFWPDAVRANADVFLTAEVKLHHRLAAAPSIAIIEIDHSQMERASLGALAKLIEAATKIPVSIINQEDNLQIF